MSSQGGASQVLNMSLSVTDSSLCVYIGISRLICSLLAILYDRTFPWILAPSLLSLFFIPHFLILALSFSDSEYSRTLLQAWVPLLPSWKCKKRYGERYTSRMLCAGSLSDRRRVDSCQGDSGGPLVCQGEGGRWVLTGVISWGHGCGDPSFPGVYTRVSRFLRWIDQVTNNPPRI